MKLLYVIIGADDTERVTNALNKAGFSSTKLSTTGGFLKKGNTTLMICLEDQRLEEAAEVIKRVCGKRRTVEVDMPYIGYGAMDRMGMFNNTIAQKVEVGGAILFATDVTYFNKI